MKPASVFVLIGTLALVPLLISPSATLSTMMAPVNYYVSRVSKAHPRYWNAAPNFMPMQPSTKYPRGYFREASNVDPAPISRASSVVRGGPDGVIPLTINNFESFVSSLRANDSATYDLYSAQGVAGVEVGQTPWFTTFGEGTDDSTRFQIASISKTFTAVAMMQIIESNPDVSIDDNINDYLPESARHRGDTPVTIAQCLTHMGGFEEFVVGQGPTEIDEITPLAEYLSKARPPQSYPPGKVPAYSNYAFSLVGLAVETIAEMPLDKYMQDFIFTPLGMVDTVLFNENTGTTEIEQSLAPSNVWVGGVAGVAQADDIYFTYTPAGAIWSTPRDMTAFMEMLLLNGDNPTDPGNRILEAATVTEMMTSHWGEPIGTGYGLYQYELGPVNAWLHDGDMPTFSSRMVILPSEGFAFFVSTSAGGAPARDDFLTNFRDTFLGDFVIPTNTENTPAPGWKDGNYVNTRTVSEGCLSFIFQLQSAALPIQATPSGISVSLEATGTLNALYQSLDDGTLFYDGISNANLAPGLDPDVFRTYPYFIADESGEFATNLASVNGNFPAPAGWGMTAMLTGLLVGSCGLCCCSCFWCCSCCVRPMTVQQEYDFRMAHMHGGRQQPLRQNKGGDIYTSGGFGRVRQSITEWNANTTAAQSHQHAVTLAIAMGITSLGALFLFLSEIISISGSGPTLQTTVVLFLPILGVIVAIPSLFVCYQAFSESYWYTERRVFYGFIVFSHLVLLKWFFDYDLMGNQCWS